MKKWKIPYIHQGPPISFRSCLKNDESNRLENKCVLNESK